MTKHKISSQLKKLIYASAVIVLLMLPKFSLAAQTDQQRCDSFKQQFKGAFDWVPSSYCSASGFALVVINLILGASGVATVLFLVVGGFLYLTSAGNEEQTEKAKKIIINSVIGLVVIIMATAVITIISNLITTSK